MLVFTLMSETNKYNLEIEHDEHFDAIIGNEGVGTMRITLFEIRVFPINYYNDIVINNCLIHLSLDVAMVFFGQEQAFFVQVLLGSKLRGGRLHKRGDV
jgi:hypothetical protein